MNMLIGSARRMETLQTATTGDHASSLLLQELQHRIANTLTILNATLRFEFAAFADPRLDAALERCQKQIIATAELHRFLVRGCLSDEVSTGGYFESLCERLSRSVLAPLGLACQVSVDDGILPAKKCELLGLTISELVTNAAKHAFPDENRGCVGISILFRDGYWSCTVSDNGIGKWNGSRGTGSRIVDGLVEALGARLAVRSSPNGTAVSVAFLGHAEIA
jgi:two-component sensor histidine kinase